MLKWWSCDRDESDDLITIMTFWQLSFYNNDDLITIIALWQWWSYNDIDDNDEDTVWILTGQW